MRCIQLPDCSVDVDSRTVIRADGGRARLTEQEVALLVHLALRAGEAVPRSELLEQVLGYSPNSRTRAVDHALARLRAKVEAGSPAIVSVHGVGYRLVVPAAPSAAGPDRFVGRRVERERLAALLAGERVAVLHGLGGIGKTRLATQVIADPAAGLGGAVVVAVGEARSADALGRRVGAALSLPDLRRDPVGRVGRALAVRGRALLTVDDAGLAPDAVGEVVARWLDAAPELRVLVVSRARIDLPGAVTLPLGPLDAPEAAELLAARAAEADASLALDPDAVRRLADRLDGVPLAIEVAASWLRASPIDAVRPEDVLAAPAIRRVVAASAAALGTVQRTAWLRLAVFPGAFDLAAAEAVTGEPLERLAGLVDAGLVHRAPDGRLRLLAPVRAAARAGGGPDEEAVLRHVRWFASRGRPETARSLRQRSADGPRREHVTDLVEAARAALDRADPASAAACLAALAEVPATPPPELVRAVLAVAEEDRGKLRWLLAMGEFEAGDAEAAEDGLRRAIDELAGDGATRARAHGWLGVVLGRRGRTEEALAAFALARDEARREGLDRTEAAALGNAATVLHGLGRLVEAREGLAVAATLFERSGHRHALGSALQNLALVCRDLGDVDRARVHLERAAAIFHAEGDRASECGAAANLAKLEVLAGRHAEAAPWVERAWSAARGLGLPRLEAAAYSARARVEEALGHVDEALGAAALEIACLDAAGERVDAAVARLRRSRMMERSGHPAAGEALDAACAEISASDQPAVLAVALARRGEQHRRRGDLASARADAERAASLVGPQTPAAWVAEVRAYRACLEVTAGDRAGAEALLAEADAIGRAHPRDVDVAEALAAAREVLP